MSLAHALASDADLARLRDEQRNRLGMRRYIRCRGCGAAIPTRRNINARHCSDSCKIRAYNRAHTALLAEIRTAWRMAERSCVVCGVSISGRRPQTIYCSHRCAVLAAYRRKHGITVCGPVRGRA